MIGDGLAGVAWRESGRARALLAAGLCATLAGGCSVRQMATRELADSLSGSGGVFATDNDPELVGDALPFSLKLMESVLAETPEHEGLLLALSRSFAQYGYGFVELEADMVEEEDYEEARRLRERAAKLYRRARDYGLRALEVRRPGFRERFRDAPEQAVEGLGAQDVPFAYWTGLPWAGAISLSLDDPEQVGDLAYVDALARRALELRPDFDNGGLQSFFVAYEMGRPGAGPDAVEKARAHYRRAVELSGGKLASVHVTFAESVALELQDEALFEETLRKALAIDVDAWPAQRLTNLLYQRRAEWLLSRKDWLFL